MEKSKLTIRVPQSLLYQFRKYAKKHNTTMTALVETFVERTVSEQPEEISPIVQRLTGILSDDIGIEDYKTHLDEKYGG